MLQKIKTGDALLFSSRPIRHPNFAFPIELENAQTIDIILREPANLFFSAILCGYLLVQGVLNGYDYYLFWHEKPAWNDFSLTVTANFAKVRSITQVVHTMGLSIVAEFVEDEKTMVKLRSIKIDYVQGYPIHKPELL